MKRALLIFVVALSFFALGWVSVCSRVQTSANERIARADAERARAIAVIRQQIYGPQHSLQKGISVENEKLLERSGIFTSEGSITISYLGGLGSADIHLQVKADGNVMVIDHGDPRKACTLDQIKCSDFFRRVMTSGILNYSSDIVELKLSLTHPNRSGGVMDAPMTEFKISVPELAIDKKISVYSPRSDLKHYPDIIEFQLIVALEDEILGFLPKDDLFRSPKTE